MNKMLLIAGLCLVSLPALAQKFEAHLNGAEEVPPKQTKGTGTFTGTLDGDKLTYELTYQDLTGPATMAHLHGPADPGANAPVSVPFTTPASPIKGTVTLTPQQVDLLKSGKDYANVHTDENKGGEIRGQVKQIP